MAKQPPPLQGTVTTAGTRPVLTVADRNAPVQDLIVKLAGGRPDTPLRVTFTVKLNTGLARTGRAEIIDETNHAPVGVGVRSDGAFVFRDVSVVPTGTTAARVFRITNIRANAAGLGGGVAGTTPVTASISLTAGRAIPLTGAVQTVATVRRA